MLTAEARALFQLEAHQAGRGVPCTGRRHLALEPGARILVPLAMAGEDGALLAWATSASPGEFELHVCPEPRNRALADHTLAELAAWLCDWLDPIAADLEPVADETQWHRAATRRVPQLVVPTPAGATLLRRLAERMVWRGDASDPLLRRAGGWLMFFADRHEVVPFDHTLLVATEALSLHFVPPISAPESVHLPALVAALDPPAGQTGPEAAGIAEALAGGTLTTPLFDLDHLGPAIREFNTARRNGRSSAVAATRAAIHTLLLPEAGRLVEACHSALGLLRPIPAIPLGRRQTRAAQDLARHAKHLHGGGFFARADSMRRALGLLSDAEKEAENCAHEARRHDPVVRAIASMTGEACDGVVERAYDQLVLRPGNARRTRVAYVEVRVAGGWRPTASSYQPVDGSGEFTVFGLAAHGRDSLVTFEGSGAFKAGVDFARGLATGDSAAFTLSPSAFPSQPVPESLPWMLRSPHA